MREQKLVWFCLPASSCTYHITFPLCVPGLYTGPGPMLLCGAMIRFLPRKRFAVQRFDTERERVPYLISFLSQRTSYIKNSWAFSNIYTKRNVCGIIWNVSLVIFLVFNNGIIKIIQKLYSLSVLKTLREIVLPVDWGVKWVGRYFFLNYLNEMKKNKSIFLCYSSFFPTCHS